MSYWICCNSCFLSPSPERKLAVTSCGHVICSICYQKGNHGRCLVCSSQCQVSPLSDKSGSDVKALFSDIGDVATRHLTEISRVVMFQARHQKRLLNYYKQRNQTLEQLLVKMKQEMQQMTKTLNEQSAYIAKLKNALHHHSLNPSSVSQTSISPQTPHGYKDVLQIPYNSSVFLPRHVSSANLISEFGKNKCYSCINLRCLKGSGLGTAVVFSQLNPTELMKCAFLSGSSESMEVDERSLFRKPNSGPRLSVMKPQEGRMGTVSHRPYHQNPGTSHCAHSATVSRFPATPESFSQSSVWKSPIFKPPSSFRHSMSSLGFSPS